MSYSEAQQALSVEIVARYGGQVTSECLAEVRNILGNPTLPKVTIYRWLQKDVTDKKPITVEARQQAARALDQIFEDVARTYAEHALEEDVISKANATQSMIAAGTAVDKMRLLRDLPTEIIGAASELTELALFFRENNIEMSSAIREWRERLQARKSAQNKVSNG